MSVSEYRFQNPFRWTWETRSFWGFGVLKYSEKLTWCNENTAKKCRLSLDISLVKTETAKTVKDQNLNFIFESVTIDWYQLVWLTKCPADRLYKDHCWFRTGTNRFEKLRNSNRLVRISLTWSLAMWLPRCFRITLRTSVNDTKESNLIMI